MSFIDRYVAQVAGRNLKVVLPEGLDERVVAAARRLKDQQIADPVVLGKRDQIETAAAAAGVSLEGITTVGPLQSDRLDAYTRSYVEGRELDIKVARRMVKRPLYFAGMMVAQGDAHTTVAGVATPTSMVIQAGVLTVGLAEGIKTPSSFFVMVIPNFQGDTDKAFLYTDCAVNIAPTADQLADIAIAAGTSATSLLPEPPRVALLSFSTHGSASHADIDKVTEALGKVRQRAPELLIGGEFQADTAIVPKVAAKKVQGDSSVAGRANVLVFPDLDAGNIAYKLTQYMAGAAAIGPFLQGFAKPISDLSRGASVDDIVAATAICLSQVDGADCA